MKVKISFLLIGLILINVLVTTNVTAVELQPKGGADVSRLVDLYNNNVKKLPEIVRSVIGTETIRVTITYKNGTSQIIGAKTEKGLIKEYQETPYPDSTLALYISEEGIEKIATSDDPLAALQKAWGKEIRYEGLTIVKRIKVFSVDVGFKLLPFLRVFSKPLSPMGGINKAPREQGISVDLSNWWQDVPAGRDVTIDPIAGGLYLYWLDENGTICHGNPGISGQPGALVLVNYSKIGQLRDTMRSGESITIHELRWLQNESYSLTGYDGNGAHLIQYGNQIWRDRSAGQIFEDYTAIQSSFPIELFLGEDYISPGSVKPIAMLKMNGYNCGYTEYGYLPIPDQSIPSEGEGSPVQHPTKCLNRQVISASALAQACLEGRLQGSFQDGYFYIVPPDVSMPSVTVP